MAALVIGCVLDGFVASAYVFLALGYGNGPLDLVYVISLTQTYQVSLLLYETLCKIVKFCPINVSTMISMLFHMVTAILSHKICQVFYIIVLTTFKSLIV